MNAILVVLVALPLAFLSHAQDTSKELIVRVLDVGQGDAILVQNGGSNVLIDGGPTPQVLGAYLDAFRLNGQTIDAVILTHGHADHYMGLREVFAPHREIRVGYVWENQDPSPNVTLSRLRQSIFTRIRRDSLVLRDTDDPCGTGAPLCTIEMRGGARIHIMRPDPYGRGANNRSAAVKIVGPDSASFTMWLAGDAEHAAIDYFGRAGYTRQPGMQVDVLKANHHGSSDGISRRYMEWLQPSAVVISLAAVNDYGHVHDQTRALLRRRDVRWYRTDQNGTVTVRSPGTPRGGYTITVERGNPDADGPSDGKRSPSRRRGPQ